MRRAFTALDALVIATLLLANWVAWGSWRPEGSPTGLQVLSAEGTERISLGAKRELRVSGPLGETVVEVSAEGARILASPCPLHLCVRSGSIHRVGQVVACLPNRVAIELIGPRRADGAVDAVGR